MTEEVQALPHLTVKTGNLPKPPSAAEETNQWWHSNIKKCHGSEKIMNSGRGREQE